MIIMRTQKPQDRNMNRKIAAVQQSLKELGKDHSVEAAQKIIDKFESKHQIVYLIDELIDYIREHADWQDATMQDFEDWVNEG